MYHRCEAVNNMANAADEKRVDKLVEKVGELFHNIPTGEIAIVCSHMLANIAAEFKVDPVECLEIYIHMTKLTLFQMLEDDEKEAAIKTNRNIH